MENLTKNAESFESYFRITAYLPQEDFCFIIDCNGMFEKLWQFSSFLVQKGLQILQVGRLENMLDVNLKPTNFDPKHLFLRATADSKPETTTQTIDGTTYKAIKVADKIYIPDKNQVI